MVRKIKHIIQKIIMPCTAVLSIPCHINIIIISINLNYIPCMQSTIRCTTYNSGRNSGIHTHPVKQCRISFAHCLPIDKCTVSRVFYNITAVRKTIIIIIYMVANIVIYALYFLIGCLIFKVKPSQRIIHCFSKLCLLLCRS